MKRGAAAREAVRSLLWLTALAAGIFAPRAAGWAPGATEAVYGRFVYPFAVRLLGFAARRVEWSLVQIVLLAGPVVLLVLLVTGVRRAVRRKSLRRGLGAPSAWIAAGAILVWLFQLAWGLNDARPTIDHRLALAPVEPDPQRLSRLVRRLAAEVNRSHDWAVSAGQLIRPSDEERAAGDPSGKGGPPSGGSRVAVAPDVASDRLNAAYDLLLPATRALRTSAPRRPRLLGRLLPRLGLSGFYFPYTTEASVAIDLPAASSLFVTAHEMAHQRGIAREDEANFLAFLACRESGLPVARYGGALGAFNLAAAALGRAAPDSLAHLRHELLADGPTRDRAAIRRYWDRRESRLEPVAHRANDAYLKASGQRAGVAAYGEAVRLLLAWEAAGGFGAERADLSPPGCERESRELGGPHHQSRRPVVHLFPGESGVGGQGSPSDPGRRRWLFRRSEGTDRRVRDQHSFPRILISTVRRGST